MKFLLGYIKAFLCILVISIGMTRKGHDICIFEKQATIAKIYNLQLMVAVELYQVIKRQRLKNFRTVMSELQNPRYKLKLSVCRILHLWRELTMLSEFASLCVIIQARIYGNLVE